MKRFLIIALLLLPAAGEGATYYVDTALGTDNATQGTGSGSDALKTLNYTDATRASNGDTVHVAAGTYAEGSNSYWTASKNITWIADGEVIVRGTGTGNTALYVTASGGASWNGFTFDGEVTRDYAIRLAAAAANNAFTNCTIYNADTYTIFNQTTVTTNTFDNCTLTVAAGSGIGESSTGTAAFTNGTVNISGGRIFYSLTAAANGAVFTGNTVNITGALSEAFYLRGSGTYNISNNVFTISADTGFFISLAEAAKTGTLTFEGNTFTDNVISSQAYFMKINNGTWAIGVTGNTFNLTYATSAERHLWYILNQASPVLNNNTFTSVTDNSLSFAWITSTGTASGTAQVKNNAFTSASTVGYIVKIGEEATGAGDNTVAGTQLDNNTVTLTAVSGSVHGIFSGFQKDTLARKNKITSAGAGYGILFKGDGSPTTGGMQYNVISGISGYPSLYAKGVDNVAMWNNTVYVSPAVDVGAVAPISFLPNGPGENSTNGDLKNNIISAHANYLVSVDNSTGFTSTNNLYYQADTGGIGVVQGDTYADIAAWQAVYTGDVGGDPKFTSSSDFRLLPSSPAVNAGVDVGLTTDFRGMTVPQRGTPDIGAYEFGPGDAGYGGAHRGNMGIHWMW